ncbi:MAG: peptidase M28, partial [Pseudomonadota bacterium]
MRATKILLSIAMATMAACQTNQSGDAPLSGAVARAQFAPVSEAALEKHIAILSSDRFEGREAGTPGGERTRAYLIAEMRRLGLEPLGGNYALPVTLVSRTLDLEQSKVHVAMGRRTRKGRTRDFDELSFGSEAVFWTRRDRGRVSLQASKLVFAGHGIVAPEYGWNDYAGVDVRGKTVIVLINDPGFRRGGDLFGGKAMSYYGRWTYKFVEAARQGADGILVIHQTEPASYGWNVVSGPGSNRGLDLPAPPGSSQPLAIEGWITEEQAEALFDAAGADFAALEKAASQPGFQAQPLDGLSLSAELFQKRTKVLSANIAGVIPGTQYPDEYVLYTAHWDHLVATGSDFVFVDAEMIPVGRVKNILIRMLCAW